jgi:hypothetical protein
MNTTFSIFYMPTLTRRAVVQDKYSRILNEDGSDGPMLTHNTSYKLRYADTAAVVDMYMRMIPMG